MPHPLDGCRTKIARASGHIENLQRDLKAFGDANPQKVRTEYDHKTRRLSVVFIDCKQFPTEFSIIIGEVLYQLRSTLDHLIWQLIVHNNAEPPSKSGFPIFTSSSGYGKRKNDMISGVSATAESRVEALQPYHKGAAAQSDPLWIFPGI